MFRFFSSIIVIILSINFVRAEETQKNDTIKNTGQTAKNESTKHAGFYVEHFKALKQKYQTICNKTNKSGVKKGIPFSTVSTLFKTCVTPEIESLKKHLNRHHERNHEKVPEIPDYLYPELWNKIINKCFRNKVANFCHRTKEGVVEKDPHNQPVEEGFKCAATHSVAFIPEIKELYAKHADTIKITALKQMVCVYDFFINLEANDGKYVPSN